MEKGIKNYVVLLIFLTVFFVTLSSAAAHPGHGTPIEEPSDPGSGDSPGTGSSSGSTTGGSTSSGSTSANSASSSSGTTKSSGAYSGTQSAQTGTSDSQTTESQAEGTDNNQNQASGTSTEEVIEYNGFSTSPGGPTAMIGLFVVIGLIFMAFPYKEGGFLSQFQNRLFG